MSQRYHKSEELLKKALEVIPLGSQTFSKSITQYPHGVSPYFITKGEGCTVWDLDGNKYTDFVNGLLCVNLGYADPDVNKAVATQLQDGVTFSLPHPLEVEVAQMIIDRVPCAEMVRFGKNGTDATSGAIRLARAYTKRDKVITCGYHGWQDWSIAVTSKNDGIPEAVKNLSYTFKYNDIESLKKIFADNQQQIAAVIMEPMNTEFPKEGFLEEVKVVTNANGALLVFDETITGFRFSTGGAQKYFNVTPDLATFGKGVANGFPLAVLTGRKDVMTHVSEIFFSGTFGGETLSLAAAKAVMEKMDRENVVGKNIEKGEYLISKLKDIIKETGTTAALDVIGHPVWSFVKYSDWGKYDSWTLKTYVLQELFARGILSIGTHNISHAHQMSDIDYLLKCYKEIFTNLAGAVKSDTLPEKIHCEILRPLFRIR